MYAMLFRTVPNVNIETILFPFESHENANMRTPDEGRGNLPHIANGMGLCQGSGCAAWSGEGETQLKL